MITVGCLVALTSFGLRSAFGLFLGPMALDLSWQREPIALALAIQNICWGLSQPVAGAVSDKYGARIVIVVGSLFYAVGILATAHVQEPLFLMASLGIATGIGIGFTSFGIVMAALSRIVPAQKRSVVLGMVTAASSMGQLIIVPVVQGYIDVAGWVEAMSAMGITALAIGALALLLQQQKNTPTPKQEQQPMLLTTIKCAAQTRSYVLLTLGFFVCGFQVAFIGIHLPAFIVDKGLDPILGATALACIGLFNVAGSYIAGWWGAKYSKAYGLSAIYFGRSIVTILFLSFPVTELSTLLFASSIGLLWLSTVPLTSGLVANFFGVKVMGTLFGIVFFSHQIGSFLGVWLGGLFFDLTGSYDIVWSLNIALGLAAAIIHLPIKDRSYANEGNLGVLKKNQV